MNLTEMANHVCAKVRKTDAESLAICKAFLNRGYETLYHEQLWRQALGLVQVAVDPASDDLHAQGVVLLPPRSLGQVIACRTDNRAIGVAHYEELLGYDQDVFEDAGDPASFVLMRPVVHQFSDLASALSGLAENSADDGVTLKFEYLNIADALVQGEAAINSASTTDLVSGGAQAKEYYSVSKPPTTGRVALCLPPELIENGEFSDSVDGWTANGFAASVGGGYSGNCAKVQNVSGAGYIAQRFRTVAGRSYNVSYFFKMGSISGGRVKIGTAPNDASLWSTSEHSNAVWTGYAWIGAFVATGSETWITLCNTTSGDGDYTYWDSVSVRDSDHEYLGYMGANETEYPRRQRLQLVQKPQGALTLTVLGKREFLPMTDYSSPILPWCVNCLMDFAQADMLERDRQYAKAQAKRAEAVALLDRARMVEVFQQAHRARLMPWIDEAATCEESGKGYW